MANAEIPTAPLKKEGAPVKKEITIEVGDGELEKVIEGSPEHLVLSQDFDARKKYMFELADFVPERTHPVILTNASGRVNIPLPQRKFPADRNIVLSSQIIWKGQRRIVRYYDGCTTIFADKQPKDRETLNQLLSHNKLRYRFIDGKFGAFGFEKMLLLYLSICSWNVDSPFRTPSANGIFKSLDGDSIAEELEDQVDAIEQALKYAKEAPAEKMYAHADRLHISRTDWDSGNELSEKEVRALYRKKASENPKYFLDTYNSN